MVFNLSCQEKMQDLHSKVMQNFGNESKDQIIYLANVLEKELPDEYLEAIDAIDLYGRIISFWQFIRVFNKKIKIKIYNPEYSSHGWSCENTVIEIIALDTPFFLDTITTLMNKMNIGIHYVFNSGSNYASRDHNGKIISLSSEKSKKN